MNQTLANSTSRFFRFCVVGASGVGVNLGVLMLAKNLGAHPFMASVIAIELSICSNFLANDMWTFSDRRSASAFWHRWLQFQLVSLIGAGVQFCVFVLTYFLWSFIDQSLPIGGDTDNWFERLASFAKSPPDLGLGMYVSQLLGIGVATGWNFFVNLTWTWRKSEGR